MTRDRTPLVSWSRWPSLLPAAVLLVAVVVDVLTPSGFSVFPLLAAAPVLAAPVYSLSGTIATGVVTQLIGMSLSYTKENITLTEHFLRFTTVVVLTVLAAILNQVMAKDRKQLKDTREVAEAVQRAVLPASPERVGPLDVASRYRAAAKEAAIGGDLYAIHPTPDSVRMMIADVRGKGLGAVRTVNRLLGAFYEAAAHVPGLTDVVDRLEELMQRVDAEEEGGTESFATAVLIDVPNDGSAIYMINLGHPAPLLVHQGRATPLEPSAPSLPLGLGDLGRTRVPVDRYTLPHDATLVLFTDGLVEARDRHGTFYDPVPFLSRPLPTDPGVILDTLLADLTRYTEGRLDDDAALMAVTRLPDVSDDDSAAQFRVGVAVGGG
ncbi:PP2C family protein-serine/threonine phosphatase [Streptomyces sp. NBC_01320]|uniref:PP2C family protein-serine/threonine phosphatase n=1 Tax=Streptomyces sp. NBC_01320 TaxID=2903824 RepID=UPI002E119D00|nr:serine/threonine-protein phosphatase [Streptomyces sp. NBC_01320]